MAKVLYDVVATTGNYVENGETKRRYHKIGVMLENDHGPLIKLEVVPTGWDGVAYLYPQDKGLRK